MLTVMGEALVDEVVRSGQAAVPHVGGSPLNVAVGLARLGHAVQFLGRFGRDAYGEMVATHLRENYVMMPLPADSLPTSVARALLDESGAAQYEFELDWTLPEMTLPEMTAPQESASEREEPELSGSEAASMARNPNFMLASTTLLHVGSIATMLAPGAAEVLTAVIACHPQATISYDPNCRPSIIGNVDYARAQAEKFVRLADIVKASDEDLIWLYPGIDPKESARAWLAIAGKEGPAVVVVTQGEAGPWAVCTAGEASCAVPAVKVVDTVGAGDSFMAALLSAIVDREMDGAQRRNELRAMNTQTLSELIEYASSAAAVTVSRAGANPPSRAELNK